MEAYLQYGRLKTSAKQDGRLDTSNPASGQDKPETGGATKHSVEFDYEDPHNPRNWSTSYKVVCSFIIWNLVFVTGWASAADSTAGATAAIDLHVSSIAEMLATAMYLFGVGTGCILAGPLSETVGRVFTYLSTFMLYLIWVMATALSPNFAAQILFRLLAGFFASASMSIYGGSLADLFDRQDLALVWPFFALSPLLGPTIAPIASGWIADYLGWRWVDWVTLIISAAAFLVAVFCLPETMSPVILSWKASALRVETGDDSYRSEHDEQPSLVSRLNSNVSRIVYFIFRELTTVLFGLYMTLLYILMYGFLQGFKYIFTNTYFFNVGYRYTCFSAIAVGMLLAVPYVVLLNYFATTKDGSDDPAPEQRLKAAVFASPLLPISLFWLGWTNRLDISYWSDLGACCLFGFALMSLFTSAYHYLLDTYGTNAASAMAAITSVRYLASGGIVLATAQMYEALTVKWTLTLLGCVAALLAPVPWIFWWKGPTIRQRSKWAES